MWLQMKLCSRSEGQFGIVSGYGRNHICYRTQNIYELRLTWDWTFSIENNKKVTHAKIEHSHLVLCKAFRIVVAKLSLEFTLVKDSWKNSFQLFCYIQLESCCWLLCWQCKKIQIELMTEHLVKSLIRLINSLKQMHQCN